MFLCGIKSLIYLSVPHVQSFRGFFLLLCADLLTIDDTSDEKGKFRTRVTIMKRKN